MLSSPTEMPVSQEMLDQFFLADTPSEPTVAATEARPYLGVLFECCQVYARVYRRADQKAYVARCPKCLRAARIRVGSGGSDQRFFVAR